LPVLKLSKNVYDYSVIRISCLLVVEIDVAVYADDSWFLYFRASLPTFSQGGQSVVST
jgi:hypothetical protein